jgi:hypothetical protein
VARAKLNAYCTPLEVVEPILHPTHAKASTVVSVGHHSILLHASSVAEVSSVLC